MKRKHKPMTPEQRERNKERQNRPEVKLKKRNTLLVTMNRPDVKEKLRVASAKRWANPEEHKKTSDAVKKSMNVPEIYEKYITGLMNYWNTPESREKIKFVHNTPDAKSNHGIASKLVWNRPGEKERRRKIAKESHNTPEYIEKQRNITKNLWKRLDYRQKLSGINHWNYIGIPTKYCSKWTPELRERIRSRFKYVCFLSGKTQNNIRLDVHHVDYNKSQGCRGVKWCLIPLTKGEHSRTTSGKRWYWFALLRDYWIYKYLTFHGMDIFEGPSRTEWLWEIYTGLDDRL